MSQVVITGSTGFIGGYLVDALVSSGYEVTCLVRGKSNTDRLAGKQVRLVPSDFADVQSLTSALASAELVFHLAGLTHALSRRELMKVNGQGTRNLAQACAAQANPPKLLFVSSLSAVGATNNGSPLTEAAPCRPISNYGASKRCGELAAAEFADRVPVSIARPAIVFGGGDTPTLQLFRPISRFGVHFIPGRRHERRYSMIHVADAVEALIMIARNGSRVSSTDSDGTGIREGCYFISDDSARPTYAEIGDLIASALGKDGYVQVPLPDPMVKVMGSVNEVFCQVLRRPHIFARDKAREATAGNWICSAQRLREEFAFRPKRTLPDRIQETAEWFRMAGWL